MKSWFSPLLYLLASSSDNDLRRHLEFLKAENEMLRVRVPKKRIFLNNDERERLLDLGEAIGPGVLKLIKIVTPDPTKGELPIKAKARSQPSELTFPRFQYQPK